MKNDILGLCLLLCASIATKSQTISPTVPDFTAIPADWVTTTYGNFDNPYEHTGFLPERHAVLISPETDKYTDGRLPIRPENTPAVIRLGEDRHGQSESISYRFVVDPEKTLLKVKMAIVAYNSAIGSLFGRINNSDFIIQTKSIAGQKEYACANFSLKSLTTPPWQTLVPNSTIKWIDWTGVMLDLTPFSGQEVEISFIKKAGQEYDWSYVYYTAECVSAKIEMHDCADDKFKLTLSEGYEKYQWSTGSGSPTLSWQTGSNDMRLSCVATDKCGTKHSYIALLHLRSSLPESDRIIFDTIQQGDAYNRNLFDLGTLSQTGDYIYHQTFCDATTCSSRTMYSLFLRVNQRYYSVVAQICEGEDYVANGFEWRSPAAGLYYDTLRLTSSIGRDSIVCLKLTVSASHISPDRMTGNTSPCTGEQETYTIPFIPYIVGNSWRWEVPDGAIIRSSLKELKVVFTDPSQAGNIVLHYSTGCASGTVSLAVTPLPSFQQFHTDTICSGNEYHKNNFHLPRQNEEGMKLHYQFHKTAAGCDSILSLALTVLPSPQIRIMRSDSVICEGNEVQLYAQNLATVPAEEPDDFIAVGDIYCTDGSIIRPAEYAASGKTAEGVVFWVDESGKHGWIVHKENQCDDCPFVTAENIPLPEGIGMQTDSEEPPVDTAGYSNTRKFWESGRIDDYPAMKSIAFDKGWYIPAAKQLATLTGRLFTIDPILETIGGEPLLFLLEKDESFGYFSSTRSNNNNIMMWKGSVYSGAFLVYMDSSSPIPPNKVRAIRSF